MDLKSIQKKMSDIKPYFMAQGNSSNSFWTQFHSLKEMGYKFVAEDAAWYMASECCRGHDVCLLQGI